MICNSYVIVLNYKPCSLILILRYIEAEIRGVIVPTDKACIYIYIFLIR